MGLCPRARDGSPLRDLAAEQPKKAIVTTSAKDSAASSIEDINGRRLQFASFQSPETGLLLFSYRPFPGAAVAGYIQGKRLIFEWDGNTYEWISNDQPFLPDGKWAVYVWQADSTPAPTVSVGALSSDPDNLAEYVARYRDRIKK